MKKDLRTTSQLFLITGLIMAAVSILIFDYRNNFLNLFMYATLSVGFALNLIVTLRGRF